jgi:hypothetical protein|nr:MAG TPA: hypothetical protein [Caudoviricetes sp.]
MLYVIKLIAKILVCLADLAVICVSMITVAPITLVLAVIILAVALNSIAKDIENKE